MAGVVALLGVSFDRAVLASILFRVLFFVIPYLVSLGFYALLLRRQRGATKLEVGPAQHDA
jgi:hypothetical protein